jgi:hypothetical protein
VSRVAEVSDGGGDLRVIYSAHLRDESPTLSFEAPREGGGEDEKRQDRGKAHVQAGVPPGQDHDLVFYRVVLAEGVGKRCHQPTRLTSLGCFTRHFPFCLRESLAASELRDQYRSVQPEVFGINFQVIAHAPGRKRLEVLVLQVAEMPALYLCGLLDLLKREASLLADPPQGPTYL